MNMKFAAKLSIRGHNRQVRIWLLLPRKSPSKRPQRRDESESKRFVPLLSRIRMKPFCWATLGIGLLLAVPTLGQNLCSQCGDNTRQQVETIDSSHATYAIDMVGKIDGPMTLDPIGYWAYDQYWEPNVRVTMENIGDTPVVNPWLQRAGTMDTRTLKSIQS
jgi:hypothetical protein